MGRTYGHVFCPNFHALYICFFAQNEDFVSSKSIKTRLDQARVWMDEIVGTIKRRVQTSI